MEKISTKSNEPTEASPQCAPPLEGVRVLEFGQFAAGPYATMLLADWGADVVKVEPPVGDMLRSWPPVVENDGAGYSLNFASVNRNKRSFASNLKEENDAERVWRLIENADILLENYRPGVMERLGFDYETARRKNPRLVYCSVSGYGQEGPYAQRGAFDVAVQGISGMMSVTGEAGGPPAKCGVPVADFGTAAMAAMSCLVALRTAERSGQGRRIDISMLGCMLGFAGLQTSEFWGTGNAPRRLGSAHPRNAPYQAFRGSDGKWFIIAAGTDKLWRTTCEIIGMSNLHDDARFTTQYSRAKNQGRLAEILQAKFNDKPGAAWVEIFDAAGVPTSPVLDYAEALSDPHVLASGLIRQLTLPNGVETETLGNPVKMSDYNFEIFRAPPVCGEHTAEVLSDWCEDVA